MRILPVLLFLLIFSCNGNKMKENDLSGVYVRSFHSEYAVGVDTLRLDEVSSTSYRITKSSSYQRITNGKLSKNKEFHTQHWLGIFDPQYDVLDIQPSGKVLSVDLDKQEILLGTNAFKRIMNNE